MANPKRDRRTVKDVIPHGVTVQHLDAKSPKEAVTALLNAVVIQGVLPMDKERSVRESILEREGVASTGIGNGIAIPHAKSKFADRLGLAIGISAEGIDFHAHDGMDAYIVALWVCPPAATKEHLALMRGLASIAQDANLAGQLQSIKDKKSLHYMLEQVVIDEK
ncbi:MAG: PTS sugar transporter subunit IIA [Planctomycetota bacterium]|jgi:PTS system fructose-specific IIC component